MIYSPRFTVILDACVLYPAPIRDNLLNLADLEIFSPKWSEIIQEEWIRNLLKNRTDLSKAKLGRTIQAMNVAFPDAEVHSFEEMIGLIELPDSGDRHVLAAGIKCKADGEKCLLKLDMGNCTGSFISNSSPPTPMPCACIIMIKDAGQTKVKGS